jgi:hypothetical protein
MITLREYQDIENVAQWCKNKGYISTSNVLFSILEAEANYNFFRCPLCDELERTEDKVAGVCLTCSDAITFEHNNRRSRIIMLEEPESV